MGATVVDGGVEFRVWAPDAVSIDVEIGNIYVPLARGEDGVWHGVVADARAGTRYRYRIDGGGCFPDPYSRSQPEGPHGPSAVVDPDAYVWHDEEWAGLPPRGLAIYECHVGTYTREGTFDALVGELDVLRDLGITAIELMPVAEFPGRRNWGYDGVDLFAPTRNYGGPDALKRLVDAAHRRGLGIILDVVYNHFGPDGNYLLQYARDYITGRYKTPWGDAINYDGERSAAVRRFVIDNACYWLNEYHIDGLRLDATFAIFDASPRHILEELVTTARASVREGRQAVFIAETHENDPRYVRGPDDGGYGFDAVWSDDFHHVVYTIASREHSGYYEDYAGTVEELARTINRAWLFEGQHSKHLRAALGVPADGLPASSFVYFVENHDQVGNRAFGRRFSHLVGPGGHKFWSALLLLLPYAPMIFMGQEFAASTRFHYFTDHNEELGRLVTEGRRREFAATFGTFADLSGQREIPDPQAEQTFFDSKLNFAERREGVGEQIYRLHRELLALRRTDEVVGRCDRDDMTAIAANESLLLVHMRRGGEERLIVANAGVGIDATPAATSVRRDLVSRQWEKVLSTDERRFGGSDDQVRFDARLVSLPPYSVVLLRAKRRAWPAPALGAARALARTSRRVNSSERNRLNQLFAGARMVTVGEARTASQRLTRYTSYPTACSERCTQMPPRSGTDDDCPASASRS